MNLKKIVFLFLTCWGYFILHSHLLFAESISTYERKLRLENDIISQIYVDLDHLVDREWYKITVVAKIKRRVIIGTKVN